MKSQYNAQRTRNLFPSPDGKPFKLSRSKIENFIRCKRCFYLDRVCGTEQPPVYPYTLNNAVDALLKKEFDRYRVAGQKHPYLETHGIDAIPFVHTELNRWRTNQQGIQFYHEPTNFLVHGAVDDLWVNPVGELIVVDYKATSTTKAITLDDRDSYKRQMEVYQWLLRRNGFTVSNTGYFLWCNGISADDSFNGNLRFDIVIMPYEGNHTWVEGTLHKIKACLSEAVLPEESPTCDYCKYLGAIKRHLKML